MTTRAEATWQIDKVVYEGKEVKRDVYHGKYIVTPRHIAIITLRIRPRWTKRPLWLWGADGQPTSEFIEVLLAPRLAKAVGEYARERGEELRVASRLGSTWRYDICFDEKLFDGEFQIAVKFVNAKDELQIFNTLTAALPQVMEIFDE